MNLGADSYAILDLIISTLGEHVDVVYLKIGSAITPEEWSWFIAVLAASISSPKNVFLNVSASLSNVDCSRPDGGLRIGF